MNYHIETYKNFSIHYNDDRDKFECEIELNNKVKSTKRATLKDVRSEIDQFYKVNLEFKPFKFLKYSKFSNEIEIFECTAIRTDGKFICKNVIGNFTSTSYFSKEDMLNMLAYDTEVVEEIKDMQDRLFVAKTVHGHHVNALIAKLKPCIEFSEYIVK